MSTSFRCLKKYCVCFNAGVGCAIGRCQCSNCKNPHGSVAFHHGSSAPGSKAATFTEVLQESALENIKCKCSRTACLKLYCDCFRADIVCGEYCNCVGCENFEGSVERAKVRNNILKTRPNLLGTAKKKSGVGCNCLKNK